MVSSLCSPAESLVRDHRLALGPRERWKRHAPHRQLVVYHIAEACGSSASIESPCAPSPSKPSGLGSIKDERGDSPASTYTRGASYPEAEREPPSALVVVLISTRPRHQDIAGAGAAAAASSATRAAATAAERFSPRDCR